MSRTPSVDVPARTRAEASEAATSMIDALREAEAARDADRDADAARDRAEQARTRLLAVLKRYPALSLDLVAEMDRLNEPRVVRQLGQTLRFVRSDALVAELRRRVSDGHRAADRQAALLALEARPWASWNDVAAAAYRGDDDPAVRTTASAVLGRALLDRRFLAERARLRTTIVGGLKSSDPVDRSRALNALLHDRFGAGASVEFARPFLRDADPDVRAAAQRVVRLLERKS